MTENDTESEESDYGSESEESESESESMCKVSELAHSLLQKYSSVVRTQKSSLTALQRLRNNKKYRGLIREYRRFTSEAIRKLTDKEKKIIVSHNQNTKWTDTRDLLCVFV